MEEGSVFECVVFETIRKRITMIYTEQIFACVEVLCEELFWWRPNESSNSIGNLLLHLSGSLRHYLSRTVGGIRYERDRAAEFRSREHLAKEEVLTVFRETIDQAGQVLDAFDLARLLEPTPEPAYNPTFFHLFYTVSLHMATHAGQIIFITKMLKEGCLDEIYIRSHRQR